MSNIKIKTNYETSDGKSFSNMGDAEAHQVIVDKEAEIIEYTFDVVFSQKFKGVVIIETDQGEEAAKRLAEKEVSTEDIDMSLDKYCMYSTIGRPTKIKIQE